MQTIHLLVEDDYVETLMEILPRDKAIVIEDDFKKFYPDTELPKKLVIVEN